MATYQIPVPSMSLGGNIVENWKEFECAWEDYVIATELNNRLTNADGSENANGLAIVAATLCSIMGAECRKVLNNLPGLTEADRKKPKVILERLKQYFIPRKMFCMRYLFLTLQFKNLESQSMSSPFVNKGKLSPASLGT